MPSGVVESSLLNCSDHSDSHYALFYDSAAEGDFTADKFVSRDMINPLMQCGGTISGVGQTMSLIIQEKVERKKIAPFFWSPVAPTGYTCLGDIAIAIDSRVQPSRELVRCVRDDLLVPGSSLWEWSDAGSGGAYDATAYLTTNQVGVDVNKGLSPNNFDINQTNSAWVFDSEKVNWVNGPKVIRE
jgi:hypothetical protein